MDERKIEILRWVVCIVGCITVAFLVERSVSELQKEYNKLLAMDMTTIYESLKEGEQAYVEVITNGVKHVVGYKLYVPENTIIQQIDLSAPK